MKKLFMIMAIFCFSSFTLMAQEVEASPLQQEIIAPVEQNVIDFETRQIPSVINEMGPREVVRDLYEVFLISGLLDTNFVPEEGELVSYYEVLSVQPKTFAHLELERLNRLCAVYGNTNNTMLQETVKTSIHNIKVVYGKQIDTTIIDILNRIETSKPENLQENILYGLIDNYLYDEYWSVQDFWKNIDSEIVQPTDSFKYSRPTVVHTVIKE